jgi:lipoic acid synthetase
MMKLSFKIPKRKGINRTKSGIMLGLGEKKKKFSNYERHVMLMDVVTIGQYLQPSKTFTG